MYFLRFKLISSFSDLKSGAFLSFSFVEKLIKDTLEEVYWTDAITYFTQNTFEIHNIAGIPVYFSRKLVKTPIMVIGEIEWE